MTENGFPVVRTATLADQVYEYLLRQISTRSIAPGALLREVDIVAQTGVSRTPIREALLRLAEYGLVEMKSRSAQVRRLSHDDVVHIYQVRQALECYAVRLACGSMTEADVAHLESLAPEEGTGASGSDFDAACQKFDLELHRLIAMRSGNAILAKEIRKFHDLVQLVHTSGANHAGWHEEELRQHLEILAALKAGDRRAAQRTVSNHLRKTRALKIRYVRDPVPGAAAARQTPSQETAARNGA